MSTHARDFFLAQQLNQLVRRRLDTCLQAEAVTSGQYMVLSMLGHREPQSSAELARLSNITAQSMGEYIKALEAKGLVERSDDPGNRRIIHVQRTQAGRKSSTRCEKLVDAEEASFFSALTQAELAAFRKVIGRLRQAERKKEGGS